MNKKKLYRRKRRKIASAGQTVAERKRLITSEVNEANWNEIYQI